MCKKTNNIITKAIRKWGTNILLTVTWEGRHDKEDNNVPTKGIIDIILIPTAVPRWDIWPRFGIWPRNPSIGTRIKII